MPLIARIKDIAEFLPERILANEELANLYPGWSAEKIYEKTGIKERRVVAENETATDLAVEAVNKLFSQNKIKKTDIDFIIFCTQAPDYILPTSACLIQNRLGLSKNVGALDINLGCSGFVYGLSLAKGLIETGAACCVLLITADTYSKFIHPGDKSVRTLFGDAAVATAVVAEQSADYDIGPFVFGTDGAGAKHLIVETGGSRQPRTAETAREKEDASGNIRAQDNLFMDGAAVMSFTLKEVPLAVETLMVKAGLVADDINYYVLHQANRFMLEALRKKLGIDPEKMPINMEYSGNTVSSTVPLMLCQMRKQGLLSKRSKLMLVGFGVGFSWAACILNF